MGFGRFICVALPFLLTVASLAALLAAGLAGVADKGLFMFRVDTSNLTISQEDVVSIAGKLISRQATGIFHDPGLLSSGSGSGSGAGDTPVAEATGDGSGSKTNGISAKDLNLYEEYKISLWGYCYTAYNGTTGCTSPKFDWATTELNMTKNNINGFITAAGALGAVNVTLPKEVSDAITAFSTVTKWTEVVFIIGYITLGFEVFFGIFANCSRIFSCITWIVAGFATVAVCTAAALSTAMSVIVVGALEGSAKIYGLQADLNGRFLATVWISAAFAIASGFFWIFTICCCAPDHSSRGGRKQHRNRGLDEGEKLMGPPGAYQPISDDHGYRSAYSAGPTSFGANRGGPRAEAYEPYKAHANV